MPKVNRAKALANSITEAQVRFFNMSEDERIDYINKYEKMQPYQKVALRGCRNFMSAKEKLAFKKVASASKASLAEEKQPNQE